MRLLEHNRLNEHRLSAGIQIGYHIHVLRGMRRLAPFDMAFMFNFSFPSALMIYGLSHFSFSFSPCLLYCLLREKVAKLNIFRKIHNMLIIIRCYFSLHRSLAFKPFRLISNEQKVLGPSRESAVVDKSVRNSAILDDVKYR